MPEPSPAPEELLALALGSTEASVDLEAELDLGAFLCACPDLQLHGCLGRGGMGVVYRARQVRLDRDVAVKLMNPVLAQDPEFAQRFEREAKALARLDHPGIVAVHEFGQAAGVYYLVMELVEGPNLRELMRLGLEPGQAAEIVGQLCDALAYAHDRGVVHRDIKPENVLVDRRGRVRVADFGLAKLQREDGSMATRTRRVMGTPQYMAPEQVRDPGDVDHRSDIFAIGVLFYELLTGQLPVGRFPPPSELAPGDAGLDAIVLRALEFDRRRRYQTASEIGAALSTLRDVTLPSIAAPVRPVARRTLRPRAGWWVASVGALAAGAALAIGAGEGNSDPEAAASLPTAVAVEDTPVLDETAMQRWPARALAALDPEVAGVIGVDWGEIRQAPLVGVFGETVLADASPAMLACKRDVLDQTHKVLVGLRADGGVHELSVHGEWTPEQVETCLGAIEGDEGPTGALRWTTSRVGELLRIETQGDTPRTVTVGRRGTTIVASFDPDVTAAHMEAKLAGAPSSEALRDRVARAVDLGAPIFGFAEPGAGVLPLEIVAVSGVVELWDELAVDGNVRFASDAAAAKAKTLIESYATVIASIPEVSLAPKLTIEQQGDALHLAMSVAIPLEAVRAELDARLETKPDPDGKGTVGEATVSLRAGGDAPQ
ncbi:MAG: serine/threonine protein kinase [Myxococcales bacterium]|nr:serine/threonine protein kinase [Myxococcales bacterium]